MKINKNFKVGDLVICINNQGFPNNPLRLNTEYVITKIRTCECGLPKVDVGINLSDNYLSTECECGFISASPLKIHWFNASRFVKKDTRSIDEKIAEAISKEDYELAEELSRNNKGVGFK